jgi:16S rRNA (cytosine1402-N4)-methyltransferase
MLHRPVLLAEILDALNPQPNQHFIDATLGEGGHAQAILEHTAPGGIVLGIDKDSEQIERAQRELSLFEKRIILLCNSFSQLGSVVSTHDRLEGLVWQGILFDLGWSQAQLEQGGKGLSFLRDEPLDMRLSSDSEDGISAQDIVNTWSREDIEHILRAYGEESLALGISEGIVQFRKQKPLKTTFQLVEIIKYATPRWYQRKRIHYATKTFQALRIAVNDEVKQLQSGLEVALNLIASDGRLVVISFHSGEDRIVKQFFRDSKSQDKGAILTKHPLRASREEIRQNRRARSAKLRVFKKA